ncbi:MAG: hypothetical protein WDZ73_00640 [Candidatus Paceibacterota bacterium]
MSANNKQSGFLKIIILVIVAIAILAYFQVDIRGLVDNISTSDTWLNIWTTIKDFSLKVWTLGVNFWQEHISPWFKTQTS